MWSERGQTARFQAAVGHLELRAGDTLLDFGCGAGRLAAFLPRDVRYVAHDTAPAMLDRVAADVPDAVVVPVLPDELYDHVVAVGPFNLPHGWSVDRAFLAVADLWANHTRRTLIVSLYRGDDPACLSYPVDMVAGWARSLGARRFVVDASYLDNDVLMVLRR